jgi:hypothetical protein
MFFIKIAFVLGSLIPTSSVWAETSELPMQKDIDHAFELILSTHIGRAVCRDILGADAQALEMHLGMSKTEAASVAKDCAGSEPSEWIYPTSPNDIRKITLKSPQPRVYKFVHSDQSFPIESWTDPYSNVTTILISGNSISFPRLVQILAHEMAVYLDSKSHPLYPSADQVPHLRDLNIISSGVMNPLIAISDPLQAHTMTYLRALQVEFSILNELVGQKQITAPQDLNDPYLLELVSERCQLACIEDLIEKMRDVYLPVSLPLLAFSSHYRALIERELTQLDLNPNERMQAGFALRALPIQFMKRQFTGDVVADLTRVFFADESQKAHFKIVSDFLKNTLWNLEKPALYSAHFSSGLSLLEFMKRPLLSGYNIALASGPRVRIRTGGIE